MRNLASDPRDEPGRIVRAVWYVLLFTIPVTSFPLLASLTGGSQVTPLAGIPLLILLIIWMFPRFLRGERLSELALPFLAFILVALISSAASLFLEIHPYLNETPLRRILRAALTLAIGAGFYFVAAKTPCSSKLLRNSLLWIYLGGLVILIWSTVQGTYILDNYLRQVRGPGEFPAALNQIQRMFSTHNLYVLRATGLAVEPSWLADQLVILYLPLWLASVLQRTSIFTTRRTRLSFELLFLIWGVAILFLSQSRIGYVSFFAVLVAIGISAIRTLEGKALQWILRRRERNSSETPTRVKFGWNVLLWLGFTCTVLLAALLVFFVLTRMDPRFEQLVENPFPDVTLTFENPFYVLSSKLAYAERVMYWTSGLKTFAQHPFLGVGLGNVGFFFEQNVPSFGSRLPEIIEILNGWTSFPNSKSLWVRLLAETGIVGFLLFTVWLILIASVARRLRRSSSTMLALIGLAGLLSLLAQIFEGFSLDTFALPQLWIMLGLVTATSELQSEESGPIDRAS